MLRRLTRRLSVGGIRSCKLSGSVVHACKYPCYMDRVGEVPKDDIHYLTRNEGHQLFMNMVDPDRPVEFPMGLFEMFFLFMRGNDGRNIVIHCNHGRSRAPALAMLWLFQDEQDYNKAYNKYHELDPHIHLSEGIGLFLHDNWNEILRLRHGR